MTYTIYGLCDPASHALRYIGITKRWPLRLTEHTYSYKQGGTYKTHWVASLHRKKLKPEGFVIETHLTREAANQAEQFFIAYFTCIGARLTNATSGGEGVTGRKWTAQERAAASASRSGVKRGPYKPRSAEHCKKLSAAKLGKRRGPHTDETKEKISASQRGKPRKKHTEETKKKISDIVKRRRQNDRERREQVTTNHSGRSYTDRKN